MFVEPGGLNHKTLRNERDTINSKPKIEYIEINLKNLNQKGPTQS